MTVIQYFHHLDQHITLAINLYDSSVPDALWQFFSMRAVWIPLYVLVAAALVWRLGWKRGLVYIVACALTVLACDQVGNLVKNAVQRLRPCWDLNMIEGGLRVLEHKGSLYGFYSAHAANAMGFAVCSYRGFLTDTRHRYKVYPVLLGLWAVLVGMSRVFVGKHFMGDVCVGFAAGILFAWIFSALAARVAARFNL